SDPSGVASQSLKVTKPDGTQVSLSCGDTFSDTTTTGTYTVTYSATDSVGNSASTSVSFTVKRKPSAAAAAGVILPSKTHIWTLLTPGEVGIMKILDKDMGINEIRIEVKNRANNVRITVRKLSGKPAEVTKEIEGNVYSYFKIEHYNLEGNLKKGKIKFFVSKSWMKDNGVNKLDIVLERWDGDSWEELPTKLINEDEDYVYYEAEVSTFSVFAVAGIKKVVTTTSTIPTTTTTTSTTLPQSTTTTLVKVKKEVEWLPSIVVLLIIILIISFSLKFILKGK
ncbi:MAG TPA: PGF-pre-PGF domain-containing protein, partial [Candidatus Aenigmarchaeota archaeon]|nr:PGF-pre-PGF domain-containing protein [Candidatus Aenigmarchaeota archaeon]